MRASLHRLAWFLVPFLLILGGTSTVVLCSSRDALHLWINRHHGDTADAFFAAVTWLGDGWTVVVLTLLLLSIRFRHAIVMATANIFCALVTQTLKHGPFADALRPVAYFAGKADLHLVPGVAMYSYNSFPSGHAAVALAIGLTLASMTRRPLLQVLALAAALVVAFSRVYLSQHFLGDICAGGALGVLITLAVLTGVDRWADRAPWLHQSLTSWRTKSAQTAK